MAITGHDAVAIVELIFYIPTAFAAIFVCSRHGFSKASGWIYTLILCLARIAGAICQLLTISNPTNTNIYTATAVIDSLGLSPLLLATLGVLSRFIDLINLAQGNGVIGVRQFRLLQLLLTVGLILSIVGGTSTSFNPDGTIQVQTTSKVAIILFIVAFIGIVLMYLVSVPKTSYVAPKERRVPVAIALALPFILVRLIYSACSVFLHNKHFSVINGSIVILVLMAVATEFIVVAIYIILGFVVDKLDASQRGPLQSRGQEAKKGRRRTRQGMEGQELMGYQGNASPPRAYV